MRTIRLKGLILWCLSLSTSLGIAMRTSYDVPQMRGGVIVVLLAHLYYAYEFWLKTSKNSQAHADPGFGAPRSR